MGKRILFFIVIITLISVGFYFISEKEDNIIPLTQNIGTDQTQERVIMLSPKSGDTISSPVTIKGSVSGTWFFEGVVFGKITDEEGKVLGQGPLIAKEEWMTEESVFFEGVLPFDISSTKKGFVIIEADNPSGLGTPKLFRLPIYFDSVQTLFCTGEDCEQSLCAIGEIAQNGVCVHIPN